MTMTRDQLAAVVAELAKNGIATECRIFCPYCDGTADFIADLARRGPVTGSLTLCKWCDQPVRLNRYFVAGAGSTAVAAVWFPEKVDEQHLSGREQRKLAAARLFLLQQCGPAPRTSALPDESWQWRRPDPPPGAKRP